MREALIFYMVPISMESLIQGYKRIVLGFDFLDFFASLHLITKKLCFNKSCLIVVAAMTERERA